MAQISIKYQVLKPNPTLTPLLSTLQNVPASSHFQVPSNEHTAIRKYAVSYSHHKDWLQLCEWRYNAPSSVCKCYFVNLLPSNPENSQRMKEVYVQHMEMTLTEMRKVSSPEAVYLLSEGLKGYKAILQKVGRVEVSPGGMGIDKEGKCIVWLSDNLSDLKV